MCIRDRDMTPWHLCLTCVDGTRYMRAQKARKSSTGHDGDQVHSCGTYPMWARYPEPSRRLLTGCPSRRSVPALGRLIPVSTASIVVLPAPLGPTRALTPTGKVADTGPSCQPDRYRTTTSSSSIVSELTNSTHRCTYHVEPLGRYKS